MSDLCIVAGQGCLPEILRQAAPEARIVAIAGAGPPSMPEIRLETLASDLARLHRSGVRRLCLAGGVRRPEIDPSRIDAATMPFAQRIGAALGQGDDAALRVLLAIIEEHGIEVVGANEIAPELLPSEGCLGALRPSDRDVADAERAFAVLAAMGSADVGQGCIVAGGQVLAVETLPGTDWMLASVAVMRESDGVSLADRTASGYGLADILDVVPWMMGASDDARPMRGPETDSGIGPSPRDLRMALPEGGVFAKAPKLEQDRRVDMPTIGPDTITRSAEAGLSGIVVKSGGVLVLEPDVVAARADAAGLFIWVRA